MIDSCSKLVFIRKALVGLNPQVVSFDMAVLSRSAPTLAWLSYLRIALGASHLQRLFGKYDLAALHSVCLDRFCIVHLEVSFVTGWGFD